MAEANTQQIKKERKKKRSTAKGAFHRIYNSLRDKAKGDEPTEMLKAMLDDLETAYAHFQKKSDDFYEVIDSADEDERPTLKAIEDDLSILYEELCIARKDVISKKDTVKTEKEEKFEKVKSYDTIKTKKLDAPHFSGDIREYPSFKKNYERHMRTVHGDDPYALRICLRGDAALTIRGVEDDYVKMFERLDLRYGCPQKLVDAILGDLKALKKIPEGDMNKLVQLIDIVERSWLDLERMKMSDEMDTVMMISYVEKLLPDLQRREWALYKQSVKSTRKDRKFIEMLEFLLREKAAIEYMVDDVRDSKTGFSRGRVHVAASDVEEGEGRLVKEIADMHSSMKLVIDGLAQVSQAMSNPSSWKPSQSDYVARSGERGDRTSGKYCWIHSVEGHDIRECLVFKSLDVPARFEEAKKYFLCFCCLRKGHISRRCMNKVKCPVKLENNEICGKYHDKYLHMDTKNSINNQVSERQNSSNKKRDNVLLMVSSVYSGTTPLTVLWDPGANLSLISRKVAHQLKLRGRDVTLSITKVGNVTETVQSKEYVIQLNDRSGTCWFVTVYEIEDISAEVGEVDVKSVAKLFQKVTTADLHRPSGKINLLIGLDWCKLMPTTIEENGNIQLMENQFGFCIRGSHPSISTKSEGCSYQVRVHLINGEIENGHINSLQFKELHNLMESFVDMEQMGISVTPKCGGCKCGRCMTNGNGCSIQEERETRMIESGLVFNEVDRRWTITFPWMKSPKDLPNNYTAALGRLKSTERRLTKLGSEYTKQYHEQIQDMIKRDVACPLSEWERWHYSDPVHYIPHHEVLKASSTSTPLRIVFNSSSSYMGHVLNDYWPKGANLLADMIGVMLRFRQYMVAVVGDIKKMYNVIALSYYDQHVHRFLWRDMMTDEEPTHYKMLALTFGDRPSGNIATLALRKTAQMYEKEHPRACQFIERNCYVDDLITSVDDMHVAQDLMKETEEVIGRGGFQIKHWICSHAPRADDDDCRLEEVSMNILTPKNERVLGIVWNPESDDFQFQTEDKVPLLLNQTCNEQSKCEAGSVTLRHLVGLLARIYDPMGFLLPYVIEGKLLMRKTFSSTQIAGAEKKQKWDMEVDMEIQKKWKAFTQKLISLQNVKFPRCVQVKGYRGEPELIIFSDASEQAYATCAYVRWEVNKEHYESNLLMAKNRLSPKRIVSIPRLELCAAVIATRMRKKIENEMDYEFACVVHFTDSMIVRDQIKNESREFKTFTAVRLSEIHENSNANEWFWIPSDQNPADLATRAKDIMNEEDKKMWINGPRFLQGPFLTWPIKPQKDEDIELPDLVGCVNVNETKVELNDVAVNETKVELNDGVVNVNKGKFELKDVGIIDLDRFNDYNKLINVTTIIIDIANRKSFKLTGYLNGAMFQLAERRWIKVVQAELGDDWTSKFRRLGVERNHDGFITVGKRLAEWFSISWKPRTRILLPCKNRFTHLYVQMIHEEDHTIDATIAKVRQRYWVPQLVKLVKGIKENCIKCKIRDKQLIGQSMGPLPLDRLLPNPPFSICAVDLFGPVIIRDSVKKRSRNKAYGVIFNCLTCRAAYIDIAEGYDTESFLICLRRFFAIRGCPQKILSDQGSQLIGASKELKKITKEWDWQRICNYGKEKGVVWQFTKSADAPWLNGCSESLIRLTKRNLMLSVGSNVLTFSEIQMIMFEVANLLNERPIGMKSSDPVKMDYLCPNDLILGRASANIPHGDFDEKCSLKQRHKFCQLIANDFWKRWQRMYFDTLIVQQKWHTNKRNVCVGDIVLLQDSNSVRGKWQLAEVCEAVPGSDGNVRDVKIRYKALSDSKDYKGARDVVLNRSVHRLVLILPVDEKYGNKQ